MTITTANSRRRASRAGFTIVEAMVSVVIGAMALAAVLSSLIFITRGSLSTVDYAGMDREARLGLETFAREVRMAEATSNFSTNGVRLRVRQEVGTYLVDYTYRPADKTFYRAYGTAQQQALIKGIETFTLKRYSLLQNPANNDLETKQLQLELRAVRTGPAKAFTSNNVISARYVLRNKVVSN